MRERPSVRQWLVGERKRGSRVGLPTTALSPLAAPLRTADGKEAQHALIEHCWRQQAGWAVLCQDPRE
jgi:hypothetical protein